MKNTTWSRETMQGIIWELLGKVYLISKNFKTLLQYPMTAFKVKKLRLILQKTDAKALKMFSIPLWCFINLWVYWIETLQLEFQLTTFRSHVQTAKKIWNTWGHSEMVEIAHVVQKSLLLSAGIIIMLETIFCFPAQNETSKTHSTLIKI